MKKFTSLILAIILCISLCATASAVEIPDGATALIWIPCLHIKMPIYTSPDQAHNQDVIDKEQSAIISHWCNACDIGDHLFSTGIDGKGEWNIQKVFSGAYAYYYTQGHKYLYECYLTAKADYNGNYFTNGRLLTPCSSYDLILSCCAEDVHHNFVAVFHRVKEY